LWRSSSIARALKRSAWANGQGEFGRGEGGIRTLDTTEHLWTNESPYKHPNAFIFPRAASAKRISSLSNQFREILVNAGLVEPCTHEATGKGRSQAREPSEISFHSLRHSAVTMLKAAGVSDFVAREIVGHESAAISRQYTHLSTDDLRTAMQRLPDHKFLKLMSTSPLNKRREIPLTRQQAFALVVAATVPDEFELEIDALWPSA
jgi:integrase